MIGTANLDLRSLTLNEQVGLLVDDPAVTAVLDRHLEDDMAESRRLLPDEWRSRGVRQRAKEIGAEIAGSPFRGFGGRGLTSRRP